MFGLTFLTRLIVSHSCMNLVNVKYIIQQLNPHTSHKRVIIWWYVILHTISVRFFLHRMKKLCKKKREKQLL